MPKHKPIKFQDNSFNEDVKETIGIFVKTHPIASSVAKALFATAVLGGVLTTAAVAPGILGMLGKSIARERRDKRERYKQMWARFHDFPKHKIF